MKLPIFDPSTWTKIRGPMLATQLYLIVMAAIGQLDFFRLVCTYYIECSIATLCVVFFYSTTLRIAFQRLLEWIARSFVVGIVLLFAYLMLEKSGSIPLDTIIDATNQNLPGLIQIAAIYCAMQFSSAWIAARRAPQPKQRFYVAALYPASIVPLAMSLLIMVFVSALVAHFAGAHPSDVTERVVAAILTAVFGVLRELFSHFMFPLLTKDGMPDTD
ncbi:MAG: hypothetical protein ABI846_05200 [Rudaea sp.]